MFSLAAFLASPCSQFIPSVNGTTVFDSPAEALQSLGLTATRGVATLQASSGMMMDHLPFAIRSSPHQQSHKQRNHGGIMTQDPGGIQTANGNSSQVNEASQPKPRKKHPKKLKAYHLTPMVHDQIIRVFKAKLDYDETAIAMQIPGLTGRVVEAVIDAYLLGARKPTNPEAVFHNRMGQAA